MAKADSVHSTPPTDTSENSSIREGDAALIEAVKDIAACDDALNELYKLYGDAYEDCEPQDLGGAARGQHRGSREPAISSTSFSRRGDASNNLRALACPQNTD